MDRIEFKKELNNTRKKAGESWYTFMKIVEGKNIEIKGYKTWLQIFRVNGISHHSAMDISVKEFNNNIESIFN